MAEKHIWPKIISSQTENQTSSQPSRWPKLLAFTNSLSFYLSGFFSELFSEVFLWQRREGKKWAKRPNLDVVDPKREARFIPVVSKYWPVPSQLTPLKPGFLCCTAKLSVLSVCSTQRCCCWQQRIKPDKQILILKHVVCWWIMIRCLDLFALFSKNEHCVLGFLYDK